MAENIHQKMERWCSEHHLNWRALTPAQAMRAEQLAQAPMTLLPESVRGGMMRWIVLGIQPGSFLLAVLRNDLHCASAFIDADLRPFLADIAKWLHNYARCACYGTPERVAAWPDIANPAPADPVRAEEVPY